jgi:hypothetical protein
MTVHVPSWLLWAAANLSGLAALFFLLRHGLKRLASRRSRLWLVGRHVRGDHWDVQGVFSHRERAEVACHNGRYFMFPLDLDFELPEESAAPFKLEYPKRKKGDD